MSSSSKWWLDLPPHILGRRSLDDIKEALEGGYNVNQQHPENNWTILHSLFRETHKPIDKIMFILNNHNPNISLSAGNLDRTIFYSFTLWSNVDPFFLTMIITKLLKMDEHGYIIRQQDAKNMTVVEFLEEVLMNNRMRDGENWYTTFIRQMIDIFKSHMENTAQYHVGFEGYTSPMCSLTDAFDDDFTISEPSSSYHYSLGKKRTQRV